MISEEESREEPAGVAGDELIEGVSLADAPEGAEAAEAPESSELEESVEAAIDVTDGAEPSIEDTAAFLKGLIEALLFVSDHPLELKEIARGARIDRSARRHLRRPLGSSLFAAALGHHPGQRLFLCAVPADA